LGNGFTRNQADFVNSFNQGGGDGCEFGLDAASSAITRALPRTPAGTPENARRLREGATLAVLYISDEYAQEVTEGQCGIDPGGAACNTGVGDLFSAGNNNICQFAPNAAQQACIDQVVAPYIQQIRDQGGVAFAQVINPNPAGACNQGQFRCPQPGSGGQRAGPGYIEVVNAFGGTYYSPCVDKPGPGAPGHRRRRDRRRLAVPAHGPADLVDGQGGRDADGHRHDAGGAAVQDQRLRLRPGVQLDLLPRQLAARRWVIG
jgi:hypothetical protein